MRATYVLSFDPGTKMGWAMGAPGDPVPLSGSTTIRKPKTSYGNLGRGLRQMFIDLIAIRKPDLVVWEAPWSIEAWGANCIEQGRVQNGMSCIIPNALALHLMALCEARDIAWQEVNNQSVTKHYTGTARHGGREKRKAAVIARAHLLRHMPDLVKDDDRADAIANWDYACAKYGGRVDQELLLHDPGKMRFQGED